MFCCHLLLLPQTLCRSVSRSDIQRASGQVRFLFSAHQLCKLCHTRSAAACARVCSPFAGKEFSLAAFLLCAVLVLTKSRC